MSLKSNEIDWRELQKQVIRLQQKINAKTDTIVRLGEDLQASEDERRGLDARVKTLERNLERSESDVQQLRIAHEELKQNYSSERSDYAGELKRLTKENQLLKIENQELLAEKNELRKDCKTFRQTIAKYEVERISKDSDISANEPTLVVQSELETHEKLLKKYKQIESDLQTVLGIKEELLLERDELKRKVDRLSSELSYLLNGDPRRVAEDLDSLVAENRFLKAKLNTAEEESETIKTTLAKYKSIAEAVHTQTRMNRSPKSNKADKESMEEKTSVAVINMKQIRELLAAHSIELDESDYRAITTILLDLCNDKQMALAHLRRANKVLGTRLHEVETKLSLLDVKSRSSSPRHEENIELRVPNQQ